MFTIDPLSPSSFSHPALSLLLSSHSLRCVYDSLHWFWIHREREIGERKLKKKGRERRWGKRVLSNHSLFPLLQLSTKFSLLLSFLPWIRDEDGVKGRKKKKRKIPSITHWYSFSPISSHSGWGSFVVDTHIPVKIYSLSPFLETWMHNTVVWIVNEKKRSVRGIVGKRWRRRMERKKNERKKNGVWR